MPEASKTIQTIEQIDIEEVTDNEYEAEHILELKRVSGKPYHLIEWEGYPQLENTWEPTENLTHCRLLILDYYNRHNQLL